MASIRDRCELRRAIRKLSRPGDRGRFSDRGARVLGGAVDHQFAPLHGHAWPQSEIGANFAGQFESFLGLETEADFLTAVRACWAALWTTNLRRYMDTHGLNPRSVRTSPGNSKAFSAWRPRPIF